MVRVPIAGLIHIQKMMDATRAAGYRPLICSPCRSWDKQAELLREFERLESESPLDKVKNLGKKLSKKMGLD